MQYPVLARGGCYPLTSCRSSRRVVRVFAVAEPTAAARRCGVFVCQPEVVRHLDIGLPLDDTAFGYQTLAGPAAGSPPLDLSNRAFIVGSAALAFSDETDPQLKEDVISSCLLAELAASQQFDKNLKPNEWYAAYANTLSWLGWANVGGLQQGIPRRKDAKGPLRLCDVTVQLLASFTGGPELGAVLEMLQGLATLQDNEEAMMLFNIAATSKGAGNFQVASCQQEGHFAIVTLCAFHFTAPEATGAKTDALFHSFLGEKTKLHCSVQRLVLSSKAHGEVREEVRRRLGRRAADFVEGIAM